MLYAVSSPRTSFCDLGQPPLSQEIVASRVLSRPSSPAKRPSCNGLKIHASEGNGFGLAGVLNHIPDVTRLNTQLMGLAQGVPFDLDEPP